MYHFAELKWLKKTNMTTVRHPPMRQDGTDWSGGGPPPLNDNIIQQQQQTGNALFFQKYNNMYTSLLMVWSEERKHN